VRGAAAAPALVIIDFELVFDVWSLLCCCVRAVAQPAAKSSPFESNQIYPALFNKPISVALAEFARAQDNGAAAPEGDAAE